MPTGYTAELCERDEPFERFVWRCARAFRALVMMRDDSLDKPAPEQFEPSDFNARRLENDRRELAIVKILTDDQCDERASCEFNERMASWQKSLAETARVRERLMRMRCRVAGWQPPTSDHEPLKRFMLEQLDETLKWEGSVHGEPPVRQSAAEWRRDRIASLLRSIDYHERENREEIKRTEHRNRWLADLRASVPQPERAKT